MGLIMKNGLPYGGSGDTASNIAYDSTSSGLPASTVQSAIDYLNENGIGKADTEGIVVNVEIGNWIEQTDGTFTNTVNVSEVSATDIYDVSLYGDFNEEQAEAFDFLVSSIDTMDEKVVLTAYEKVDVAFSIILRGKVNLENKNVYVSDLSAVSIEYDNSKSGFEATNMQNAMDEVATMVNGVVVNITADNWDLQEDGTYKKIIALEQITGTEVFDVCLDPSTPHTEEQIAAFSELVSSIETAEGRIILTASKEIKVGFKILLYGKLNFGKGNLVALTLNGDMMNITTVTQDEYDALPESEKNIGIYVISDVENGDDLGAKNMGYDGSETGLGNNVQDAIDAVDNKVDDIDDKIQAMNSKITDNSTLVNGYCQLPNGLIFQWGSATSTATSAGVSVQFPVPYTNAPSVFVGFDHNESGTSVILSAHSITTTKFSTTCKICSGNEYYARNFKWFAIGC